MYTSPIRTRVSEHSGPRQRVLHEGPGERLHAACVNFYQYQERSRIRLLTIGQEPRHCGICEVERIRGTAFAPTKSMEPLPPLQLSTGVAMKPANIMMSPRSRAVVTGAGNLNKFIENDITAPIAIDAGCAFNLACCNSPQPSQRGLDQTMRNVHPRRDACPAPGTALWCAHLRGLGEFSGEPQVHPPREMHRKLHGHVAPIV